MDIGAWVNWNQVDNYSTTVHFEMNRNRLSFSFLESTHCCHAHNLVGT